MAAVSDQLRTLWPALAFLLAGVPLAALLDRLGFFEAMAVVMTSRGRPTPVLSLWVLAAATTIVLNLDTTVVLLTPLYLRLARRSGAEPLALAAIPLLLASLTSQVLPVSNLTTLIVADHFHLGVADVAGHLGLPGLVATAVGWLAYRRRHPTSIAGGPPAVADHRALVIGGLVVAGLLVAFVVGPGLGVSPWESALGANVVLMAVTRFVPWRHLPVTTAVGVAAVAAVVAWLVPGDALRGPLGHSSALAVVALTLAGAVVANMVNNLPGLLVAIDARPAMSWGMWSWLLGVTVGAALLPIGALANLLWLRIVRAEGLVVTWRRYVALTWPVALPALAAAALTLAAERALAG